MTYLLHLLYFLIKEHTLFQWKMIQLLMQDQLKSLVQYVFPSIAFDNAKKRLT